MDNLTMILEDNEKAMSVLAENINDMMAAEIIYEFKEEEYVFKKREVATTANKIHPLLSQNNMMTGQYIGVDGKGTLCSMKMPLINDAKQAFESFNNSKPRLVEIVEDMKTQVMNASSKFVCNICHDAFYCASYKPICDKCKEKK